MRLEAVGQRSETVRRANLSAIVRELHVGGPRVALRARGADRPDPQRDPWPDRRAVGGRPRVRGACRAAGRPRPAVAPSSASTRTARSSSALEIAVDSLAAAIVGLGGEVFERIRDRSPQRPHVGRGDRRRPRRAGGRAALAATRRRAARRRRRGGRRRRPAERRVRVDGAEPRLARRAAGRRARRGARTRRSRSRWPTTRTSAPWSSSAAAPRSAADTCCSSRARSASAAGSSSTASR